ncbi:hypothetical protein [Nitrososphaera sp.]|uniref:hypothetical protein n=1 Tax=Nitrososphaera sp. TaxID=1971748 RepID=UPI002EDB6086
MKSSLSYGVTVNRGNYESTRIDYSIQFDTASKTPEDAYKEIREFVQSRAVLERANGPKY